MGVPARIAKPQPAISVGQLDHNKLPDPMLSLVSQMLDRLSRLEEQAHAQKYAPLQRTFLQKTVPKKDEQIYSQLKQVIDPEVGIDIVMMGMVKEVMCGWSKCRRKPCIDNKYLPYGRIPQGPSKAKSSERGRNREVSVNILDEPWNWDRFKEQT